MLAGLNGQKVCSENTFCAKPILITKIVFNGLLSNLELISLCRRLHQQFFTDSAMRFCIDYILLSKGHGFDCGYCHRQNSHSDGQTSHIKTNFTSP